MVNRKALFAGVFLVAAGGVLLAAQGDAAARELIADALRLWPLALIALGVGLLLRRTRAGLAATLVAAAIPGLLFGGIVAATPTVHAGAVCDRPATTRTIGSQGSFAGPAQVQLDLSCGDLSVTTVPGSGWQLETRDVPDAAVVASGPDRLEVRTPSHEGWSWGREADAWRLGLPTGVAIDLDATVNAGRSRLDLAGARLGGVAVEVNAGETRVDLTGATASRLDLDVNAGKAVAVLPAGSDLTGDVSVAAGGVEICAPAGLGVRVHGDAVLGQTTFNGLVRAGDAWETPGYSTSTHRAELSVSASAGSVVLNPVGGCR